MIIFWGENATLFFLCKIIMANPIVAMLIIAGSQA
jgi:hypothetical protein